MKLLYRILDLILIVLCVVLVLDVFWQVLSRYMLRYPSTKTSDIALIIFIWICLLGSAKVLHERGHYDVDLIVKLFRIKTQNYLLLVNNLLVGFFVVVLFISGIKYCIVGGRMTSPTLGIRHHWFYLVIPLVCLLMIVDLSDQILKSLKKDGNHDRILPEDKQGGEEESA